MTIEKRLLLYMLFAALQASAASGGSCPEVRMVPERLPSLNLPRSGHNIFYADGELTAAGGHTTNFVPTPTAEYYADGEWHLMDMAYSHDNGFAVVLRSDEVVLGGGHAEPLGIGQTVGSSETTGSPCWLFSVKTANCPVLSAAVRR